MIKKTLLLFLVFSFFSQPIFADDPQSLVSYPDGRIMGFRGLDTTSTAPTLADGRATSLQNVKLSKSLNLRKRDGYDVVGGTLDDLDIDSPAVTGIFEAEYSDGTSKLFAFVGTKIKYNNSGTWTAVGSHLATPTVTTGKDNQWQCIMALDSAICTNDTDLIVKLDSTPSKAVLDVSDLSDALTKANTVAWYRNFLILANTVEATVERPTRFRWSNVGDTETWTDDDFTDISTFAGDEIIALAELNAELYIFLKTSIWRASFVGGDDVFVFRKVVQGVGAIARDSVQVVSYPDGSNEAIFLSPTKNIYSFNGVIVKRIDLAIEGTVDDLNEARLQYAVSAFDGESYYLSVSTGSSTVNDTLYDFNTEIREWTYHTQVDANAMGKATVSSDIRTYFGNYDAFVYWLSDPDKDSDVDGATGIIDSVGTTSTDTITGAQVIVDATIVEGAYTGAVIRITSGTGAGGETVVATNLFGGTGVVVTQAFSETPDSTSVYSIGDIDARYTTKWYDIGSSSKEKNFLGMLLWAQEDTNNEVDISSAIDFGSFGDSETKMLSPVTSSLWDSAIWDESVWATTGNKIYTIKTNGFGNFIQYEFSNNSIDETFNLYGFNILGTVQDVKQ